MIQCQLFETARGDRMHTRHCESVRDLTVHVHDLLPLTEAHSSRIIDIYTVSGAALQAEISCTHRIHRNGTGYQYACSYTTSADNLSASSLAPIFYTRAGVLDWVMKVHSLFVRDDARALSIETATEWRM